MAEWLPHKYFYWQNNDRMEGISVVCHEDVLLAARKIVSGKKDNHFTVLEIQEHILKEELHHTPKTIDTHIRSRCCANAPCHHGTTYNYFERVGRGVYKIREDYLE